MVAEWLYQVRRGEIPVAEMIERLADRMMTVWVPVGGDPGVTGGHAHLVAGPGTGSLAVLYTGSDLVAPGPHAGVRLQPRSPWEYLREVLIANCMGLVIDPGTDHSLWMPNVLVRDWLRACYIRVARREPPYLVIRGGRIVVGTMQPQYQVIPAYLSPEDALAEAEGVPEVQESLEAGTRQESWARLWERCEEVGAAGILLQAGKPDQILLTRKHLARLAGDGRRSPLDLLEEAIQNAGGNPDSPAVWAALAAVDGIWILTRPGGQMVGINNEIDLFTSPEMAEAAIATVNRQLNAPEAVYPQIVHADPLWEALRNDAREAPIWINRYSEHPWCGAFSVLEHITRLRSRTVN